MQKMTADVSNDPYEQKLYHMFTSHDAASLGSLDAVALRRLCTTLDLKDREAQLVEACLRNADAGRVSFRGFKDGLLALLGDAATTEVTTGGHSAVAVASTERDATTRPLNVPGSPPDSSSSMDKHVALPSREVSPKFVVAGKKYGRRTRPVVVCALDGMSTESDADRSDADDNTANNCAEQRTASKCLHKVQRSSSHSELHDEPHRRRGPATNGSSTLKRCASLPAQAKPFRRGDPANASDTQPGSGAPLLRDSSVESLGNLDFENLSHSLYDVWMDFGRTTNNYLNKTQLEQVCEKVGLHRRIARKVAEEVFDKLGLGGAANETPARAEDRVCFSDFIALIQCDSDAEPSSTAHIMSTMSDGCGVAHQRPSLSPSGTTTTSSLTVVAATDDDDDDGGGDFGVAGIGVSGSDSGLNMSKDSTNDDGHSGEWPTESSAVPAEVIVDMWDTAGIPNPRSLLDTLGFRSKEIRISQLSLAIEDDLQTMPAVDATSDMGASAQTLLRASLALHKSEVNALQLAFRQLAAHNRQLHASNRDTNRRAALLAQEVDERHNHLETMSKKECRQLEQRHADIVRELTEQMAAEREQMNTVAARLEKRNKTLEADDARLRLQCELCVEENGALEADLIGVQRQCAELLEENIRLNNTLSEVDERQRADETRKDDRENEELLELMEKVSSLQIENANLRDKNDELCTEVEEQLVEMAKLRAASTRKSATDTIISATKRRGDSPSKTKLTEESPKLGKLRKCNNDEDAPPNAEQSDGSGEWMALHAELQSTPVCSSDLANSAARIAELEERLRVATDSSANGQRIVELEASLELMRKEFDLLEDYWKGKMNEERDRSDANQQRSHETIDEMHKKLTEYEEQLLAHMEKNARHRLSPIAERDILEQQYVDLEDEFEMEREQNRQVVEARDAEVSVLQRKCSELEARVAEFAQVQQTTVVAPAVFLPANSANAAGDTSSGHGGTISCRSLDGDNSPASSPISYLFTQSTIQAPARDYQNPNWGARSAFSGTSTAAVGGGGTSTSDAAGGEGRSITPICRPVTPSQRGSGASSVHSDAAGGAQDEQRRDTGSETSSVHSYSAASVQSHSADVTSASNLMRDDLKKLKLVEMNLRNEVQALIVHRNQITNDIQQLQAMERTAAYTRSNNPTMMQRNCALEQRVRSLEMCLKNQHQYNENMMQRTCVQHNNMVAALHSRIEEQQLLINEQTARLVNNDIFAKDMFVENSQLGDLLEQQRMCNTRLRQHHQQI